MQQYGNNQILYSPSDLVTFLECHHASFLDVKALSEDMDKAEASTTSQLLQKKGLEHEAAYQSERAARFGVHQNAIHQALKRLKERHPGHETRDER